MAYVVSDGERRARVDLSRLETRPHDELYEVAVDDESMTVSISKISPSHLSILLDGASYNVEVEHFDDIYQVTVRGEVYNFRVADEREISSSAVEQTGGLHRITAPMPGMVVDVGVSVGDAVEAGQNILVLEAMKMQNELTSPVSGVVTSIGVNPGNSVNSGDLLLEIEA